MSTIIEPFETTMLRAELLTRLERELASLKKTRDSKKGAYQLAMRRYIAKTARILAASAKQIVRGRLKPGRDGEWCAVKRQIEKQVGDPPDDLSQLNDEIRGYEAAIFQVRAYKREELRISTGQVKRWLGGETAGSRRNP